MARINPDESARRLAAALPRDQWIIAGTSTAEPYPCRCKERPAHAIGWAKWQCSPAWCPCAGRTDPPEPDCCGWHVTAADVVMAKAAWELQRRARDEMLE